MISPYSASALQTSLATRPRGRAAGLPADRAAGPVLLPYLYSAGTVAASGTVAAGLMATGLLTHVTIVFVPAVLVSALLWGLWPAALAIGLSFAANGLLEFAPMLDLQWRHLERPAELMVFTVVVLPFCYVVVRARAQVVEARRRSAAARSLHGFSQRLAGIREEYHLRRAIAEELSTLLEQRVILFSLGVGTLLPIASDDREIPAAVAEAARQRLEAPEGPVPHHAPHHAPQPDGWTIFILDAAHAGPTAVAIGPPAPGPGNARARAQRGELLRAMLDQAAVAIDRLQQWSEVEDARVDERAARLRDALINSISHDLRTPLAAVLGSATALQSADGVLGRAARADLLATIREETERLNDYVGNVMDLSRLRGGAIQPRLELTELADIVDAALRRARLLAGRDVVVKLPPDLPMLRLDLFLLQQALVNLIENAAKYSPPKSRITIAARVKDARVELDVSDTGLGIPKDELERVFDRFYRGVPAESGPAGSGLGLAICRAFVEANGGKVHAISEGGGTGATFRITLPIPDQAIALEAMLRDE